MNRPRLFWQTQWQALWQHFCALYHHRFHDLWDMAADHAHADSDRRNNTFLGQKTCEGCNNSRRRLLFFESHCWRWGTPEARDAICHWWVKYQAGLESCFASHTFNNGCWQDSLDNRTALGVLLLSTKKGSSILLSPANRTQIGTLFGTPCSILEFGHTWAYHSWLSCWTVTSVHAPVYLKGLQDGSQMDTYELC